MTIRTTIRADIPALARVLDETGLFPADMLPDLLDGFLTDPSGGAVWLTAEADGDPVGFCYAAAEPLTEGTWNLTAIAVLPAMQGKGLGAALTRQLEQTLATRGERLLIVDTSGTEAYRATRAFYDRQGYTLEARIRDFWAKGDDKVIFRKSLV